MRNAVAAAVLHPQPVDRLNLTGRRAVSVRTTTRPEFSPTTGRELEATLLVAKPTEAVRELPEV